MPEAVDAPAGGRGYAAAAVAAAALSCHEGMQE